MSLALFVNDVSHLLFAVLAVKDVLENFGLRDRPEHVRTCSE